MERRFDVTRHAIDRFRERTGCKKDLPYIFGRLVRLAEAGSVCRLDRKAERRISRDHDGKKLTFIRAQSGLIIVVYGKRIVTCFNDLWKGTIRSTKDTTDLERRS